MMHQDRMMGWTNMAGFGIIGMLIILMLLALTILAVVAIVKMVRENKIKSTAPNKQDKTDNEAITILDKRFAQGEISEEEYYRMKAVLKEE